MNRFLLVPFSKAVSLWHLNGKPAKFSIVVLRCIDSKAERPQKTHSTVFEPYHHTVTTRARFLVYRIVYRLRQLRRFAYPLVFAGLMLWCYVSYMFVAKHRYGSDQPLNMMQWNKMKREGRLHPELVKKEKMYAKISEMRSRGDVF